MRPIYLLLLILLQLSCSKEPEKDVVKENDNIILSTNEGVFMAGQPINLKFQTTLKVNAQLVLSNAFGSSILLPEINDQEITFNIPKNFSRKSGLCNWVLYSNGKSVKQGSFKIIPQTNSKPSLETYFGPRSITAGGIDFSMLVSIATDPFDNVYPEGTEALIKSQFLNTISESVVPSKDFISWKRIYSEDKAGRILVTSSVKEITSKELTTIVFAANAESFLVESQRNHKFADGNQIMSFNTNVIRDKFDNIISDGTTVNFIIENSKGALLKTVAPTIGGIAKAAMLHPAEKGEWRITAFVTGAAKSNTIKIDFDTAITDFDVKFSPDNRKIMIGPLKSFMQQLVPDGILIQLDVYSSSGEYLDSKKITSNKGLGTIELPSEYYVNGNYHLVVKSVGIIKKYDVEIHEE